uniref:Ig-like domain-containing protein n=1 Tax=Ciona savignyi TaxID=51511 RepID=H2YI22_CIOSA
MTEQEKRDFFVAPVFHKPLQDLSTSQGECVVLECRVKGVPPPVLTWRREGDVIDDCPDFRILHRGEIATLVIGEAFPEDTGHFTCEAVNKAGEAVTSCKLAVRSSGHHSVVSKSPAPPQTFLRPVQVLPAQQSVRSHSSHVISQPTPGSPPAQTQISKFSIVPRQQPRIYVVDDDTVTSPHHDITQRVSPVRSPSPIVSTSLNINVNTSPPSPTSSTLHPHGRPTSPKVSHSSPSPSRVTSPLP